MLVVPAPRARDTRFAPRRHRPCLRGPLVLLACAVLSACSGARAASGTATSEGPDATPGSLSTSAIQTEMRSHANRMQHCYAQLQSRRPDAAGEVTITFVVDADGQVRSATARAVGALRDAELLRCVQVVTRAMRFPAPSGGAAEASYAWTFAP